MISVSELTTLLEAEAGDATLLAALERAAVAFVETQTRRYFGPVEAVVVYLEGDGGRRLWLPDPPAAADSDPTPIVANERRYPGADATVLEEEATDGFTLRTPDHAGVLVRLGNCVWRSGWEYEVLYSRGYAEGTEPADIRQLVIDLVTLRWRQRGREDLRSETIGGYSYTRFGDGDLDAVAGAWDTIRAWQRKVYA